MRGTSVAPARGMRLHVSMFLLAVVVTGCKGKAAAPTEEVPQAPATTVATPRPPPAGPDRAQAKAMFGVLPARYDGPTGAGTPALAALGRTLYHDPRLSKNQDVSCNTCHGLATFGVDGLPVSKGHKGQTGARNSPTVFNAAGHTSQFWDGRAVDVEAQAKGPVLNPVEMAMKDDAAVVAVLASIPGYQAAFTAAFPGDPAPITFENTARAIGAFERLLVTPAPFDAWLAGDDKALSPEAQQGLALFMQTGCNACHAGPQLGGTMFMKVGAVKPYPNTTDLGRMDITKNEADRFFFKVPGLRNVAKTAPYYHDGAVADLPAAVATMGELQLGRVLTPAEVTSIVAFLDSLTGTPPADLLAAPALPPSGKATPKADPS